MSGGGRVKRSTGAACARRWRGSVVDTFIRSLLAPRSSSDILGTVPGCSWRRRLSLAPGDSCYISRIICKTHISFGEELSPLNAPWMTYVTPICLC